MAYKYGNRNQIKLLPPCIDDYVGEDAPVRAYNAIIDALDFHKLEIEINERKLGNSSYNPVSMLKLLAYGYSYGLKSSRKLERACHENLSFIWLMGGLKPDHKTICEFRRKNIEALNKVLKQLVRICIKLDLVDGNILFVDGSKFRGNASRNTTRSKKWCETELIKLDQRIDQLLAECEQQDQYDSNETSYVKMNKELTQTKKLKKKIEIALSELERKKLNRVNITDPDSGIMKGRQGSHCSFNVQSVVDEKEGLIIHVEPVTSKNDLSQFAQQIQKGMENTQKKCKVACADSGYANTEILEEIDKKEIHVVVPSKNQASLKEAKPFGKSQFKYDKKEDCYYCPEGHRLRYGGRYKSRKSNYYKFEDYKLCLTCRHFGICTISKEGRRIQRYWNEAVKERLEKQYLASNDIYKLRKQKVELPFGHIKYNLGYGQFVLRGIKKVQGEISLISTCYNITRMIGKFGVKRLIEEMTAIKTPQY